MLYYQNSKSRYSSASINKTFRYLSRNRILWPEFSFTWTHAQLWEFRLFYLKTSIDKSVMLTFFKLTVINSIIQNILIDYLISLDIVLGEGIQ